ncbi:unnamed protein product [Owenia fusiformis]|uniref:Uncharacterized protein n=1 Tax=Owenia fusiformis TaxID=6347 RepID=A0A8J1TV88_OWEFU|nr:unnamed protein product [Owenia fusiformis]
MTDKRDKDKLCASIVSPKAFKSSATSHGVAFEGFAKIKFEEITGKRVEPSGLVIHLEKPFLAASPDGFVRENAICEVKCPFKGKDSFITDDINFPWLERKDGKLSLKKQVGTMTKFKVKCLPLAGNYTTSLCMCVMF